MLLSITPAEIIEWEKEEERERDRKSVREWWSERYLYKLYIINYINESLRDAGRIDKMLETEILKNAVAYSKHEYFTMVLAVHKQTFKWGWTIFIA